VSFRNPKALMIPATDPIASPPAGETSRSQADPTATPPANVAFNTTSMSSLESIILEIPQAVMQLAEIERTVLTMTLY
jgi:hypothetical protein